MSMDAKPILSRLLKLENWRDHTIRLGTTLYQGDVWTPRLFGGTSAGTTTYTTRSGIWTRHGRLVSCTAVIIWTAATGTGQLLIDGLPFTANATTQLHTPVALRATGLGTAALQAFVYFGTTQVNLENVGGGTVAMAGSGTINLQVTYTL
jgi:hypothetical protein